MLTDTASKLLFRVFPNLIGNPYKPSLHLKLVWISHRYQEDRSVGFC